MQIKIGRQQVVTSSSLFNKMYIHVKECTTERLVEKLTVEGPISGEFYKSYPAGYLVKDLDMVSMTALAIEIIKQNKPLFK